MAAPSKNPILSGWRTRALACFAAIVSLSTAVMACTDGRATSGTGPNNNTGNAGSGGVAGGGGAGGAGGDGGACPENATRDCHVNLGQHGDVVSCFDGVQSCKDGAWGPCTDPGDAAPAPPGAPARRMGPRTMSLSMAAACTTDPCDPSCQVFQETPAQPIGSPPQNLIAPWLSGSYGGLPATIQGAGTNEPCSQGGDCSFDQYCSNPISGTCSHHKCVTGTGLNAQCDSCVSAICSADSTCCNTPIQGTCSHDLCVVGPALSKFPAPCHACVNSVCVGQYAYCCDMAAGAWTAECVNRVTSICGLSCNSGTWAQGCVDKVATVCNAQCVKDTTPPACAHDKCYVGAALDAACDPCVDSICNNPDPAKKDASCCTTAWTGQCVEKVASVCGQTCPAAGDCVPWLPSQTDAGCTPFDLTVGVGCTNAGVPQVPVCNHGNSTAPAGLPVVALPAAASLPAAKCSPSLAGGTTYTTPAAIAPGKCVNVSMPGLADGALIVANPNGAAGYNSSECHCDNNWSIYSAATGACSSPSCAGASAFAKLKKVKLFVNVDRSASQMYVLSGLPGNPTRWSQLIGALNAFATDPASDDLGLWLRFWPYGDATYGNCPGSTLAQCAPTFGCKTPMADVTDLIGANQTTVTTAINTPAFQASATSGNTPMLPSLEGSLIAAKEFKLNAANAGTVPVVLMLTDGDPSQCNTSVDAVANVAGLYFNAYGIRTYVIGIAEINQTTVNKIAGAGGGKGFFIQNGTNVQVQTQVIDALNQVKQSFVSCELDLPNQAIFDPTMATLIYTPGSGAAKTIGQVADLASCAGDGWYYNNAMSPTAMTLCPTTCSAVKADVSGTLELKIDCVKQYLPSTQTQTYEATCPKGTVPQWGFLAYDTVDPGDSNVKFSVQTSDDNVTFGALKVAATARSTPADTQVCPMGGPSPCPVDLFTVLGGIPDARRKYLQLVMNINPTTDTNQTPKLNNWQVTYSCPDAE